MGRDGLGAASPRAIVQPIDLLQQLDLINPQPSAFLPPCVSHPYDHQESL